MVLIGFVHCKETEEAKVTLPEASQDILPPATAPAPEASRRHLKPRMPFDPKVMEPEAAVIAPEVLFFVPRQMLSPSTDQPPIFPFVTLSVSASIFPAVIREAFRETTSIREAETVPEVICEASSCTAFTVPAESLPVKTPSLSIKVAPIQFRLTPFPNSTLPVAALYLTTWSP